MPVSSIGTDEGDAAANAGSTPYARPPRRTGTGMLTLGWAVDQSRRAFRSRTRGSKVHPDGRRSASSRGSEGTPATPTRRTTPRDDEGGARSPRSPGSRVPPGAGQGTCLGAVMALMGFGRGGTKAIAAAERARSAARRQNRMAKRRLASTPELRATPPTASRASSRLGSESRRHRTPGRTAGTDGGDAYHGAGGPPPPSRSASMRFTPAPGSAAGPRNLWNDPSPASRGTEVPSAATGEVHSDVGRYGDDGWNGLRAAQEARRELFSSTPSDRNQSRGW